MYGIALAFLCSGCAADPVELPSDVVNIEFRQIAMPVKLNDKQQGKIKQLRLFISEDRGRSWKHQEDFEATAEQVTFEAPEDGLYWFAVQFVFKDGTSEPAAPKKLFAQMKVFVNTSGKPVKVRKSYPELQRENEELRAKVEALEKKLAERESSRKPR